MGEGVEASRPVVSIIVVSYNTLDLTLACLRSLEAETIVPYELLVVDNASDDGSAEAIADEFKGARLFAERENHGFARANNIAAAHASGRYLLLLNPDTIVLDRAVDRLVEFAEQNSSARIWGGRTLFADGSLNPASCWRRMSLWSVLCRVAGLDIRFRSSRLFNREAYGGWDRDSERPVDIVSGCFFLVDRELWSQLDGFDLRYVMYGEEADFCLRARALGARPRITPNAEIVHYGGASESVRSQKHVKLIAAKITLAREHLPAWQAIPSVLLLRAWPGSRWVVATVLDRIRTSSSRAEARREWAEVWAHRRQFWSGYPQLEPFGRSTEVSR